jgi:putative transposase
VAGRLRSGQVIEALARLISRQGAPKFLRSDQGPEFIARAIKRWLAERQVETIYIEPGKPWQNGTNESFNGKFRDECLNAAWFLNRAEAGVRIEAWRKEYNEVRPHSSLGYRTPAAVWQEQVVAADSSDRGIGGCLGQRDEA